MTDFSTLNYRNAPFRRSSSARQDTGNQSQQYCLHIPRNPTVTNSTDRRISSQIPDVQPQYLWARGVTEIYEPCGRTSRFVHVIRTHPCTSSRIYLYARGPDKHPAYRLPGRGQPPRCVSVPPQRDLRWRHILCRPRVPLSLEPSTCYLVPRPRPIFVLSPVPCIPHTAPTPTALAPGEHCNCRSLGIEPSRRLERPNLLYCDTYNDVQG